VVNELRPKYLKSLVKIYKKLLVHIHALNENGTHHGIMNTIQWYESRGYSFEKALKVTLRKKRRLLEEILDGFLDDSDDEEEEEEEETEEEVESEEEDREEEEDGEEEEEGEESVEGEEAGVVPYEMAGTSY
jgi:Ran GTPase-activating protein (RanGAP) involved in mRNA processing and transport